MAHKICTLVFLVVVALLALAQCWELEELAEMKCLEDTEAPKTTSELNMTWVQTVDFWYYNVGSRLDMYRTAAEVLNVSLAGVKDADFYYRGCLTFKWGKLINVGGFGKLHPFHFALNSDESFEWKFVNIGINGHASAPLTDNESYIFFYGCWDDGLASFGVISTEPVIEPKKLAEIHDYAKSLGFMERHFTHIEYDNCKV